MFGCLYMHLDAPYMLLLFGLVIRREKEMGLSFPCGPIKNCLSYFVGFEGELIFFKI